MNLYSFEFDEIDPSIAFAPLANQPYSLFLDSADREHENARYSFIAAQPAETIESRNGIVTVTNLQQQTSYEADPFAVLKDRLAAHAFAEKPLPGLPPFQGGAAGLFGYDLARGIETIPDIAQADKDMPDIAIGIYDHVIAFDHHDGKSWILIHAQDETEAQRKRNIFVSKISSASPPPFLQREGDIKWRSNFSANEYKNQVKRVIEYIMAGDVFQVNLSQRFESDLPAKFDSFAHYLQLRKINPAPFAAYMNLGSIKIASASPERFLTVHEGTVETKPVKGTKPRLENAAADTEQLKSLRSSEKERAENIMIVDLLRNDLSKVCKPNSIHVKKLCAIESFTGIHHIVSTVTGALENKYGALDLLRACFPGGSITGAPKIRAMEIIEELEPSRRGIYCGCMGYAGFDGGMDMNILIRSLVYKGNKVSFNVGGGITADSTPESEYQETLDKAAGIFNSFEWQSSNSGKLKSRNA